MSRGKPDYDVPDYHVAITQGDVSIFHTALLGHSLIDGRGRPIWVEGFQNSLIRWVTTSGAGGVTPVHVLKATRAFGYHGGIELDPAGTNGVSDMYTLGIVPYGHRMGAETYIYINGSNPTIDIHLKICRGDDLGHVATLRIEPSTADLQVNTPSGYVEFFDTPNPSNMIANWVNVKIVGDFDTGKYYRATVGGNVFDLSAYDMVVSNSGLKGDMSTGCKVTGGAGIATNKVYVGGWVLSGDEP